jgi:cell division cycle 2-like protein
MASAIVEEKDEPPEEKEPPEAKMGQVADAPPCAWPPTVAERYERLEKLGQGMFGDVYKARDRRRGGRLVAVKRLSGRTDDRFVHTGPLDFARQAMSLAACRGYPHVVRLVATHADASSRGDGDSFVVTKYAGPMNLRKYMMERRAQSQPFLEGEVRRAMRQLLSGAKHVHKAGVVHRDLVPENVIVDQRRRSAKMVYKIGGFGMSESAAAREGRGDDSALLASLGPYRAPEAFLGSRDYDGRVDTWALGCIMAELLVGDGKPFFYAELESEVFVKMQRVVGTKGITEWPGLQRLVGTRERELAQAAVRREQASGGYTGCLGKLFPEEKLSEAGFEVLSGLLEANPERRLTAAAALRKPWFRRQRPFFDGCCVVP